MSRARLRRSGSAAGVVERLEEGQGDVPPDHGRGLEEPLLLARQAVDARGQDGLHGRRNLDALDGAGEPVGAGPATEGTGVDEGAHALFEKEGVAAGARHQQRLQRAEAGVVAQKRLEQSVGAVGGEGVEAELEIGALARPRMAVIGAVGHQEHDARRRHRIHEGVEQGLRLGVGPVQILDDDEQGLPLARADEQALDRIEHALAPLLRFQLQPPRVVDRRVEQGQERRQQGPEAHVKAEHGGGELLPHRGGGVIGLEQREASEELDHRQVRGGAAVRSRPRPRARASRPRAPSGGTRARAGSCRPRARRPRPRPGHARPRPVRGRRRAGPSPPRAPRTA